MALPKLVGIWVGSEKMKCKSHLKLPRMFSSFISKRTSIRNSIIFLLIRYALAVGELSDIVDTDSGLHIIYRTG